MVWCVVRACWDDKTVSLFWVKHVWPLSNPNSDHSELLQFFFIVPSPECLASLCGFFKSAALNSALSFANCAYFFGFTLQVTTSGETLGLHQEAWFTAGRSGFLRYLGFVPGHLGIAVHVSTHHHPWDIHQFLAVNPTMILRIGLGHPQCSCPTGTAIVPRGSGGMEPVSYCLRCLIWTYWEGLRKWPGYGSRPYIASRGHIVTPGSHVSVEIYGLKDPQESPVVSKKVRKIDWYIMIIV